MSNETQKYTPRRRIFTPVEDSGRYWNKKISREEFLLHATEIGITAFVFGVAGFILGSETSRKTNTIILIPASIPVLPEEQKTPLENAPIELDQAEFRNLFEKLSRQPIKTDGKIDTDEGLVKNFIQQAGRYILSKDAIAIKFSGRAGKRGKQRSVILDSPDNSRSIALSVHLQGKGPPQMSADIRVVTTLMIDRDTKKAVEFLFSDLEEGERTIFLPLKQLNIADFSFWDKGKALDYYFPEIGPASMEDLSSAINILENGKVNSNLTKKSAEKLDEKYNPETAKPPTPIPQPTPKYF